jgi:hypothetical protein
MLTMAQGHHDHNNRLARVSSDKRPFGVLVGTPSNRQPGPTPLRNQNTGRLFGGGIFAARVCGRIPLIRSAALSFDERGGRSRNADDDGLINCSPRRL